VEEGTEATRHQGIEGERRLIIGISGSGFLWNMVRIIAGTLVEVGRGRLSPDDVTRAIESRDRRLAGPTFPPTGLCLEWIRYGPA
jgi:tRNA pseudouridine38-40 synthase